MGLDGGGSADGGLRFVHDVGDVGSFKFLDRGQEEGLTFWFGKAVDGAEDGARLLCLIERLVGWGLRSDEGLEKESVGLVWMHAASPVEGQVPGDADEPGAEISDREKFVLVGQNAQKGVLDGVFGFGAVAEEGVGDAKEGGGVGLDEGRQVHICGGLGEVGGGKRQNEVLEHVVLLSERRRWA